MEDEALLFRKLFVPQHRGFVTLMILKPKILLKKDFSIFIAF